MVPLCAVAGLASASPKAPRSGPRFGTCRYQQQQDTRTLATWPHARCGLPAGESLCPPASPRCGEKRGSGSIPPPSLAWAGWT